MTDPSTPDDEEHSIAASVARIRERALALRTEMDAGRALRTVDVRALVDDVLQVTEPPAGQDE